MVVETVTAPRHRWLTLVAALVLLNASVTFENLWPTPLIRWGASLSVELAVCLIAICAVAWRRGRITSTTVRVASAVWLLLVLGRYAQVTVPALYGREVNLFWDLRYIPDVVAMSVRVAPVWLAGLVIAIIALAMAALYAASFWAFRQLAGVAGQPVSRTALVGVSVAVILAFVAQTRAEWERQVIATPVVDAYAHQVALIAEGLDRSRTVADSPPMATTLDAVKDADVFLVFVEAYGAISFDRPEFAGPLAVNRSRLLTDIQDTGRQVVSAFVESPTFGGSSWLAHLSLMSGVDVRDQDTNARLMSQHRQTLVQVFRDHGYHTLAVMPGLFQNWPEGGFYHFDEIYDAKRLDYHGPQFGWFDVPDQFTLHRLDALQVRQTPRSPLFVFFPTISTHFPFSPTPPYQPDWDRLADREPFDPADQKAAYLQTPDWDNLGPGYVRALAYDYATLGGYLRRQAGRDLVMILVGDHQPAAAVSGEGASWDVPVHIVSSRGELAERLLARGFRPGLTPARPRLASMAGLLPILLDAFGSD